MQLARMASFWNSFEGWLKWELASVACEQWGCRPWETQLPTAEWLSIGVEYKAQLVTRQMMTRVKKQIDLWVCPPRSKKHVYVELKVAFNNGNAKKQFASARDDLACLLAVEQAMLAGWVVLIVVVGFERSYFDGWLEQEGGRLMWLADRTGRGAEETPSIGLVSFTS